MFGAGGEAPQNLGQQKRTCHCASGHRCWRRGTDPEVLATRRECFRAPQDTFLSKLRNLDERHDWAGPPTAQQKWVQRWPLCMSRHCYGPNSCVRQHCKACACRAFSTSARISTKSRVEGVPTNTIARLYGSRGTSWRFSLMCSYNRVA